jgi:hypothetical protein
LVVFLKDNGFLRKQSKTIKYLIKAARSDVLQRIAFT